MENIPSTNSDTPLPEPNILSAKQAEILGISRLLSNAEAGDSSIITRQGLPIAAVISLNNEASSDETWAELRDIALILSRIATDDGTRATLDELLDKFGLNREELEAELAEDIAAGRD